MQAKQRRTPNPNVKRTARIKTPSRMVYTRPAAWFLYGLLCCTVALFSLLYSCTRSWRALDLYFPLETSAWRVSSGYGWRSDPTQGEWGFHQGVDLACAEGTPVLAAMDGVVSMADRSTSYGNYVRLLHEDGTETLYAHLQYLYVRPGEVVKAGQPLGCAGQTGRATGPHLHFELFQNGKRQDPTQALGLPEAKP